MSWRALLAGSWTLVILTLCWLPRGYIPANEQGPDPFAIPHFDKIVHFGIFAGFGFLAMRVGKAPGRWRWVLLVGLTLAIGSELGQELPVVNRDASLADGLADTLGVVAGMLAYGMPGWRSRRQMARPEA